MYNTHNNSLQWLKGLLYVSCLMFSDAIMAQGKWFPITASNIMPPGGTLPITYNSMASDVNGKIFVTPQNYSSNTVRLYEVTDTTMMPIDLPLITDPVTSAGHQIHKPDHEGNLYFTSSKYNQTTAKYDYTILKWDGSEWSYFGMFAGASAIKMHFHTDGTCYVISQGKIYRKDGSTWTEFGTQPNGYFNNSPTCMAIASDGSIYIGGFFTSYNVVNNGIVTSTPMPNVAKWNGTTWESVGSGPGPGQILTMAFAPNGDLYAGGWSSLYRFSGTTWNQELAFGTIKEYIFNGDDVYVCGEIASGVQKRTGPGTWVTFSGLPGISQYFCMSNGNIYRTGGQHFPARINKYVVGNFPPDVYSSSGTTALTSCYGCSTQIYPIVNGGVPPMSYSWSNGQTDANASIVPTATSSYSITVTDSQGASSSMSITMTPLCEAPTIAPQLLHLTSTMFRVNTWGTCTSSLQYAVRSRVNGVWGPWVNRPFLPNSLLEVENLDCGSQHKVRARAKCGCSTFKVTTWSPIRNITTYSCLTDNGSGSLVLPDDTDIDNSVSAEIYPNPTVSKVNLKFDRAVSGVINIVSAAGQVVMQQRVSEDQVAEVDVENLPAGLYFASYAEEGQLITLPFMKL